MRAVFAETTGFTSAVKSYFQDDVRYQELQLYLMDNPESGAVLRGCGGLRKVRWPDPRRGKGKRGGLRVIYLHVEEASRFLMLDVYDKDDTDDLSAKERKVLAGLAEEYRRSVLSSKKG